MSPLRVVLKEEGTEDVRDESNKQTFSSVLHLYGRRSFEFRNLKKGIKNYELQVYTKQSS